MCKCLGGVGRWVRRGSGEGGGGGCLAREGKEVWTNEGDWEDGREEG